MDENMLTMVIQTKKDQAYEANDVARAIARGIKNILRTLTTMGGTNARYDISNKRNEKEFRYIFILEISSIDSSINLNHKNNIFYFLKTLIKERNCNFDMIIEDFLNIMKIEKKSERYTFDIFKESKNINKYAQKYSCIKEIEIFKSWSDNQEFEAVKHEDCDVENYDQSLFSGTDFMDNIYKTIDKPTDELNKEYKPEPIYEDNEIDMVLSQKSTFNLYINNKRLPYKMRLFAVSSGLR